jgi:hypothetical protein
VAKPYRINDLLFKPKIKVKDQEWSVVWVDRIEGRDTLGYCEDQSHVLIIQNNQPEAEAIHTYLHEVMNAMCVEYKIKLGHKTLDNLAGAFKDFLLQNKIIK